MTLKSTIQSIANRYNITIIVTTDGFGQIIYKVKDTDLWAFSLVELVKKLG